MNDYIYHLAVPRNKDMAVDRNNLLEGGMVESERNDEKKILMKTIWN